MSGTIAYAMLLTPGIESCIAAGSRRCSSFCSSAPPTVTPQIYGGVRERRRGEYNSRA